MYESPKRTISVMRAEVTPKLAATARAKTHAKQKGMVSGLRRAILTHLDYMLLLSDGPL